MKALIKKQKKRENKAITLIALIITIVILIILATVTLNVVLGEGGLIQRAQEAKTLTEQAQREEEEALARLEGNIAVALEATPITNVNKGEIFEETTKVSDANGDIFYVPGGFEIDEESPNEIDEGIVISSSEKDEDGNDTKQFVWIPVDDYTTMYEEAPNTSLSGNLGVTTDVYSKLRVRDGDTFSAGAPNPENPDDIVREPDILTHKIWGDASTDKGIALIKSAFNIEGENVEVLKQFSNMLVEEYEATYRSIKTYGGFYIGRYELTGTEKEPTVQKRQTVLSADIAGNWYELKKACTNVVSTKYAQSTMVYGNQWDEIMSWLKETEFKDNPGKVDKDSSSWGNYRDYNTKNGYEVGYEEYVEGAGSKQVSGFSEYWKANNIYDLAGNCWEWTQEAVDTGSRINRGGSYASTVSSPPTTDRNNSSPSLSDSYYSARPALYIK